MIQRRGIKILCGAQPIPGHTIPVLRLAEHLRDRGDEVIFVACRENAPLIEERGIDTVRVELSGTFEAVIRRCAEFIEELEPDITVCDWLLAFQVAARMNDITCVTSILRAEQFVGYETINGHLADKFCFDSPRYLSWFNSVLESVGMPAVKDYREMLIGDLILIPSIPELDTLPRDMNAYRGAMIEYIGPLVLSGDARSPRDVDGWVAGERKAGRPVVLVTLGTVRDDSDYTVYRSVARIVRSAGCAALCVIPDDVLRSRLAAALDDDGHIRCLPFSSLGCLISESDLVIHHCGHATALLCLMGGARSIIIPSFEMDREDNAVRLERMGVARRFSGHAGGDDLERLIRDVLRDDGMLMRSRRLARRVEECMERGGPAHAARCMDEIISRKTAERRAGSPSGGTNIDIGEAE